METLISIIVPIYNVEKELNRCVKSLINQTYTQIEIILVDDGSPDGCPQLCDRWAEYDSRILVIHKKNGGLSDARNTGLMAASGEYVLFVDSDDYLQLDSCYKFMNCILQDIDIIVGEATIYNGTKVEHQLHTSLRPERTYTNEEYLMEVIPRGEWYAPVCYNLYNRKFLLQSHLLFKQGILHEDMEFLPRVFLAANKISYLNYEFYQYVIREGSITQNSHFDNNINDLMNIYTDWKRIFDKMSNKTLKKVLYGFLIKSYIATCRKFRIKVSKKMDFMNWKFIFENSLNIKEFIKAVFFILFRKLYIRL